MKKIVVIYFLLTISLSQIGIARTMAANTKPVTLIAVGDINLGERIAEHIQRKGFDYPWLRTMSFLRSSDLTFGNLECCVSKRGRPVPGKKYTFRGSPKSLRGLASSGFDVVSLANNHARDYGEISLVDTINNLKKWKIAMTGAGKSGSAYRPVIIARKGITVAFLAFTNVLPGGWKATNRRYGVAPVYPLSKLKAAISRAKKLSKIQVVSFHWGIELRKKPTVEQKRIARFAIDNGADIILGHHPHVTETIERYRHKPIIYSLGNFVFSPGHSGARNSTAIKFTILRDGRIGLKSCKIRIVNCQPGIFR